MIPHESPDQQIRWSVLGPVRAWREGAELDLGPPQQRAVLAVLLLRQGRPVSLSELSDVVWGERPPATAVNVLHRYVGRLRRLLEPGLPLRASGRFLLRSPGGYRLEVLGGSLDLDRFQELSEQARAAVDEGRPEAAIPSFDQALALWEGSAAAGLDPEVRAHPLFTALEEDRVATVMALADAALAAGSPQEALPVLRATAVEHPWTESVQARLVLALAAAGQQAQALAHYESVRTGLADELGIDPGPELRAAHQKVLRQELPSAPETSRPRPAHLPAVLPGFTGRESELRQVAQLTGDEAASTMTIAAINGMAGIGKTTFALHWAHQIAGHFPDGQLYVNLRGFDPSGNPLDPATVIRGFLDALEVSPARIPAGLEAQAALFRSLLAERRMLLLLDNARDEEQVRPLLPGSPGHLVIVTSRNRLSGLVARDGAQPVTLGLPTMDEARASLSERLGPQRVAAEPEAVEEILARCGRLPLAVAIVAARAVANPTFPLTALADELRDAAGSLDAFADAEPSTDARVAFSWSYRALTPGAARMFRLLALRPGHDLSADAAADLAGQNLRGTRPLLAELTRAHLVTERVPGRYSVHDLIGVYASELVQDIETPDERRDAQRRIIAHYLHTAYAANRLIEPYRHPIRLPKLIDGVTVEKLADPAAATAWFAVEYPVLLAAVRQADELGFERCTWQLAWAMQQFFDRRGHWHDWLSALRLARDAAERRGDRVGLANTYRGIGTVYSRLGRPEDSYRELDRSLELFGELGDEMAQAHLHLVLGAVKSRSNERTRMVEAREHSRRALELFTAADSAVGRARALNNIGHTSSLLGDHQAALENSQAALDLHRELGDQHGEAAAWDSAALALHNLGRHQEAIDCYRTALGMFAAEGHRYFLASTFGRLGDVHRDEGQPEQAREHWERALSLLEDLGHADAIQVREKLAKHQGSPTVRDTFATMTNRPSKPFIPSPVQSFSQSFDARKMVRQSRDS